MINKRNGIGNIVAQFSLFLLFCAFVPASAGLAEITPSKYVLDNGLTVIISEMPANPTVSVYALAKAGSATEGKFLGMGISHYVEHMLFKGTTTRGVGEIAAAIQSVGGVMNASTGMDHTVFTITVPSSAFDVALGILADSIMHPAFDPKEFEKERQVIISEMRLYEDNPDRRVSDLMFQSAYLEHPYRHPIIGYKSLFDKVTRDQLIEYYASHYVPNNMIVTVAGNVKTDEALAKVKEAFKDFKRAPSIMRNLPQEPQQITPRSREEDYPTQLTRLAMGFPSVSLLSDDLYALDVLAKILGDGMSSRLYQNLIEKNQTVYSISAANFTPVDRGLFWIEATLLQDKLEQAKKGIWDEIHKIQQYGISFQELKKVQRQALSEHIMSRQTSSAIAWNTATDDAFTGDCEFSEKYVEGIRRVNASDIARVAKKYLVPEKLTIVAVKPVQPPKSESSTSEKQTAGAVEKFVLGNQLTVLVREDHTFPVVSLRYVMHGGLRQDPEGLIGLANLMSQMWLKGTKLHSASDIAEMSESRGMSMGTFSGKHSMGVSLEFLKEDFSDALGLLREIVVDPAFPETELPEVKEQVKASIKQHNDDIFDFTVQGLRETLFLTHPFRFDEEGTLESVDKITRQDIADFYQNFSTPGNCVLSVFGDINKEEALEAVKKNFGYLAGKDAPVKAFSEEPIKERREKKLAMDKEQAMVIVGFHGVTLKNEDRYPVEVLGAILGSSFSGRLFNTIREEHGQAYTLGGSSLPGVDVGIISFYVLTTKESAPQVKALLEGEIKRIQVEDVPEKELNGIKTYLKGTFENSLQTNSSLSFTASLDELYGLGFDNYQKYAGSIDAVTKEDVKRAARQYLDLNKAAVVVTLPSH